VGLVEAVSADWVLTPDGWSPDTTIDIAAGRIVALSPGRAAEHVTGALLPGLPNLHSHAFQRSFAGRAEFAGGGGDFWSWREAMYRAAGRIEPDTMAPIAAYVAMLALQGGFTALVEFHYLQNGRDGTPYAHRPAMAEAIIEGAQQAGIGLTMLVGIYQTANFGGVPLQPGQRRFDTSPEAALLMLEAMRSQAGAMLRFGLAPHSLRAVPPASLAEAAAGLAALDPAAPIHIHAAEQRAELEACLASLGTTPVAWLLDAMPVGPTWCLIHCTHTTDAERRALAQSGAVAGLCPSTEGNLGDGIFGLGDFVAGGGRFGIGTDSHVGLDAFAELRLLEYSQRLRAEKRNVLAGVDGHSGRILWQAAASGGAQAAGRPVGAISPGCQADFVAIEPTPETMGQSPDFWLDAAIFATDRAPARHVMVNGAWVVRNGVHLRAAPITAAYRRALAKLDA
jgi:formimidoylglutamate deiminase